MVILALSAVFLAAHPPLAVAGAAAGAGAAVPAVAVQACIGLIPASWRRAGAAPGVSAAASPAADRPDADRRAADRPDPGRPDLGRPDLGRPDLGRPDLGQRGAGRAGRLRWVAYLLAGGASAAVIGPWLVLVLAACGLIEIAVRSAAARRPGTPPGRSAAAWFPLAVTPVLAGGLGAVAWVAFKVGALSYGGGFVIIPLMQHDAVHTYHWMSSAQFLDAVALGQITPGPVVLTVAAVGYAAGGVGAGLLATLCAFAPSFAFILLGGRHFDRLRADARVQAFLTGAGAASIGAIAGSAVPLTLALSHLWQLGVLALAAVWLVGLRRNVVGGLAGGAALGLIAALAGAPV